MVDTAIVGRAQMGVGGQMGGSDGSLYTSR